MTAVRLLKPLIALTLTSVVLLLSSPEGHSAPGTTPTVTVNAVSGYGGHAFVFAEVGTSGGSYPAPTGTTHQSPFFAEWLPVALGGGRCPWTWAVYVFNRASNTQINSTPVNAPQPNFGTTTLLCPTPSTTPVAEPPMANASARLDLDLAVNVAPASAVTGSPSRISAVLSSALTSDLNLYMNMAIEDWHVDSWFVTFGDGGSITLGGGTTAISINHTYAAVGQYEVDVIASISGHAQAAIYDHYGRPQLIQQGFGLQIGNHASAGARAEAVRRYLPPAVGVLVSPAFSPFRPDPTAPGAQRISTFRGRLTAIAVHLVVLQEGRVTVNDRPVGFGRSRLTGWRLGGVASDAPAGTGTIPGVAHPANDLLFLQWNSPDRIAHNQPEDYVVPLTLFVRTQFSDGGVASYAIPTSFLVSINFPAESG